MVPHSFTGPLDQYSQCALHTWGCDFFHGGGSLLHKPKFRKGGVNFSGVIFGYYCIFITKYFRKTSDRGYVILVGPLSEWGVRPSILGGSPPYPPPIPTYVRKPSKNTHVPIISKNLAFLETSKPFWSKTTICILIRHFLNNFMTIFPNNLDFLKVRKLKVSKIQF